MWAKGLIKKAYRKSIQVLLDFIVLGLAFLVAYLLRFEFLLGEVRFHAFLVQLPFVICLQMGALFLFGVYRFVWRYVSLQEIQSFLGANLLALGVMAGVRAVFPSELGVFRIPYSVILIDSAFAFWGTVGLRVLRRVVYEKFERGRNLKEGKKGEIKRVLLVGAGRAGVLAAKEIHNRVDLLLDVRGFVDDDPAKAGSQILGIEVLGTTQIDEASQRTVGVGGRRVH